MQGFSRNTAYRKQHDHAHQCFYNREDTASTVSNPFSSPLYTSIRARAQTTHDPLRHRPNGRNKESWADVD